MGWSCLLFRRSLFVAAILSRYPLKCCCLSHLQSCQHRRSREGFRLHCSTLLHLYFPVFLNRRETHRSACRKSAPRRLRDEHTTASFNLMKQKLRNKWHRHSEQKKYSTFLFNNSNKIEESLFLLQLPQEMLALALWNLRNLQHFRHYCCLFKFFYHSRNMNFFLVFLKNKSIEKSLFVSNTNDQEVSSK